jgi:hypothetical protein
MIELTHTSLHVLNMWTRMPFRYGIATLTALPHLFVRATFAIGGRTVHGVAADGLAPRWFSKDPRQSVADELAQMIAVIRAACAHAAQIGAAPDPFAWWLALYEAQAHWGRQHGHPPLLGNFGATLLERAMLDAFCRARATTLAQALRDGSLGVDLGRLHAPLRGSSPGDWLPHAPRRSIGVRHTVGLADPLTDAAIAAADRLADGLPQSLDACIAAYGLNYFKIKVPADAHEAVERLRAIAAVLRSRGATGQRFTLDGNEFFTDVEAFRALWERLHGDAALGPWLDEGLLFVEQPLHRDAALGDALAAAFARWPARPPIIIDESDAAIDSLPRALACGYAGTSHKNCKGVFKGIANACLIAQRRRADPHGHYAFSGEDLSNVGPVALLQDLAVAATLGLNHVERNGHHYFAGLGALPDAVQAQVLSGHGDLYHRHEAAGRAFPTLSVRAGAIELGSVLDAPFGYGFEFNPGMFQSLEQWRFESLGLAPPSPAPRSLQEGAPL